MSLLFQYADTDYVDKKINESIKKVTGNELDNSNKEIINKILFPRINFIKFADIPTETKQISDNIKGFITKLLS